MRPDAFRDTVSMNDGENSAFSPPGFEKWLVVGNSDVHLWSRYMDPNWPTKEECQNEAFTVNDIRDKFDPTYLSPRRKGFDILSLLSEKQNLRHEDEHPLPWYPPFCNRFVVVETSDFINTFTSIWKTAKINNTEPNSRLLEAMYREVGNPNWAKEDFGQRILTALEKSLSPPWLLFNMAAVFWRTQGRISDALDCLEKALQTVPSHYNDVVLVNVAAVLYNTGHLDEAAKAIQEAIETDNMEPYSHYFAANLHAINENYTAAIRHYREALKLDPTDNEILKFMRVVACHARESKLQQERKEQADSNAQKNVTKQTENVQQAGENATDHALTPPPSAKFDGIEYIFSFVEDDEESCKNGDSCTMKEIGRARSLDELQASLSRILDPENEWRVKNRKVRIHVTVAGPSSAHCGARKAACDPQDPKCEHPCSETFILEGSYDPEILPPIDFPLPRKRLEVSPISAQECVKETKVNPGQFTSTWLIDPSGDSLIAEQLNAIPYEPMQHVLPKCNPNFPVSMLTYDHLPGVRKRHLLSSSPELGLKSIFLSLDNGRNDDFSTMATKIAWALEEDPTSWIMTTAASLYWRIMGNAQEGINCLRIALHYAPRDLKAMPLISLANILHGSGYLNDALIAAHHALELCPEISLVHFTVANLYAAKGNFVRAMAFYESTLASQPTFTAAKERLRWIHCSALTELAKFKFTLPRNGDQSGEK